jgi:hypothetical protein
MPVAVAAAAADVRNRRRSILKEKSALAMMSSYAKRRAGADRFLCRLLGHTPPVSGQTTVRLINHAISELKEFPI